MLLETEENLIRWRLDRMIPKSQLFSSLISHISRPLHLARVLRRVFTLSRNEKCSAIISNKSVLLGRRFGLTLDLAVSAPSLHLHFVRETDILCRGAGE